MSRTVLNVEDDDAVHFLLQMGFRETADDFQLFRVIDGEEGLVFLRTMGPYVSAPPARLGSPELEHAENGWGEVLERMQNDAFLRDIPWLCSPPPR